jgi:hypothetical protein
VGVGEAQCALAIGAGANVVTAVSEDVPAVRALFDYGEQVSAVVQVLKWARMPRWPMFVTGHG